jgi:hypothetical protein
MYKGDPLKAHVKVDEHLEENRPERIWNLVELLAQTLDELLKAKMLTF